MAEELETVEPAAWPLPPSPTFAHFPALQPPFKLTHAGPIAESNWAIPSHLIAGAYPGSLSPEEAEKKTRRLVESGVKVFLSLLDDGERVRILPRSSTSQRSRQLLSLLLSSPSPGALQSLCSLSAEAPLLSLPSREHGGVLVPAHP